MALFNVLRLSTTRFIPLIFFCSYLLIMLPVTLVCCLFDYLIHLYIVVAYLYFNLNEFYLLSSITFYKKEFLEYVNVNRDIQVQSHHHLLLIFLYQSNDLMNTYCLSIIITLQLLALNETSLSIVLIYFVHHLIT